MSREFGLIAGPGDSFSVRLIRDPDRCPHCHQTGLQVSVGTQLPLITAEGYEAWLLFRCPLNVAVCGRPYLVVARPIPQVTGPLNKDPWTIHKYIPANPKPQLQHPEIIELSPTFYKVMNEAAVAEAMKLDTIVGAAYRRALEFLVKDYVKHISPADTIVDRQPLAEVVKKIGNQRITDAASRAVILGNDETHYEKRWTAHDVDDLKALINITETFIAFDVKAGKYNLSMPPEARGS